jgi:hypothetical protein
LCPAAAIYSTRSLVEVGPWPDRKERELMSNLDVFDLFHRDYSSPVKNSQAVDFESGTGVGK